MLLVLTCPGTNTRTIRNRTSPKYGLLGVTQTWAVAKTNKTLRPSPCVGRSAKAVNVSPGLILKKSWRELLATPDLPRQPCTHPSKTVWWWLLEQLSRTEIDSNRQGPGTIAARGSDGVRHPELSQRGSSVCDLGAANQGGGMGVGIQLRPANTVFIHATANSMHSLQKGVSNAGPAASGAGLRKAQDSNSQRSHAGRLAGRAESNGGYVMSEHGHRNRLVDATFALLAMLCGNRKFSPCVALSGQNCKPSTTSNPTPSTSPLASAAAYFAWPMSFDTRTLRPRLLPGRPQHDGPLHAPVRTRVRRHVVCPIACFTPVRGVDLHHAMGHNRPLARQTTIAA